MCPTIFWGLSPALSLNHARYLGIPGKEHEYQTTKVAPDLRQKRSPLHLPPFTRYHIIAAQGQESTADAHLPQ